MRIAIVTEKPFMARTAAPIARALFPDANIEYPICWPIGLYSPPLLRGLAWRDYPYIAPFEVDTFLVRERQGENDIGQAAVTGRVDAHGQLIFAKGIDGFNQSLEEADQIIALMDPSHTLYHFDVARRKALGCGVADGEVRMLYTLEDRALQRALTRPQPGEEALAHQHIAYGQAKHYFDYQFAINSLAILSRTAGKPGWISKYQLQALYLMRKLGPINEGAFVLQMGLVRGTGCYPLEEGSWNPGMGSAMSRSRILEQLKGHGWVETTKLANGKCGIGLSEQGQEMLARLHPGCEDPDLPFRLHEWATQGLALSQARMDRYVRTFFGRQKRYLGSQ